MIYYLPSCRFTAANPETSAKLKKYLKEVKNITIAGCCRPTQKLLKEGDLVLNNCTSCALITEEASPQADVTSLYEYLLGDESFPWPDYHGEAITVQDCWRAREHASEQHAIRECLRRMNMVPVELEENFEKTTFDGLFLLRPIAPGNLQIAPKTYGPMQDIVTPLPPEEQKARMEEWVKQYKTDRTVVYCNSCLQGVRLGGADGVHVLELMSANLTV